MSGVLIQELIKYRQDPSGCCDIFQCNNKRTFEFVCRKKMSRQDVMFKALNIKIRLLTGNFIIIMSANKLDKYKKIQIRKLAASICSPNDQVRYEQLTKHFKSYEEAQKFNGFKDEEEKIFALGTLDQIERLKELSPSCQMLIELEDILVKELRNHQQFYQPRKYLFFQRLIETILKKRQNTKFQNIETNQLRPKTKALLKKMLLPSQIFKKWSQKYKSTQNSKQSTYMQAQNSNEENSNGLNAHQMQAQPQEEELLQLKQAGQLFKMTQEAKLKLQEKLRLRVQLMERKYPNCLIGQILLLKHQLKLLESSQNIYLSEIVDQLQKCGSYNPYIKKYCEIIAGNFAIKMIRLKGVQGYRTVSNIFNLLLPLDSFQLVERCKKSQFKNQLNRALFVIGNTGIGKSTLIQHLLGYKHHQEVQNGKITLRVQRGLKSQHSLLKTSNQTQSETTHLSAYKTGQIHLIDTPGFQDTNGALVDIANQVTLAKAYQNCRSSCYLLLFDPNNFTYNRGQQIKSLAINITERFNYETKQELASFCLLIFNDKWKTFNLSEIHSFFDQLKDKSNKKYQIALEHIYQSLEESSHFFKPTEQRNRIKQLILGLTFDSCREMKSQFDENTRNVIQKCCKYLVFKVKDLANKNQITKLRFYYSIVYQLQSIIPKETQNAKKEVDTIFIKKSTQLYNKICFKCKQKVQNPKYEQEWFDKLNQLVAQLVALNELAEVNADIKSQKELKEFLVNQMGKKLKEKVNQSVQFEKIEELSQFILHFCKRFSKYLLAFFQPIEQECHNSATKLQDQISNNFNKLQIKALDQNIQKYEKYRLFYSTFAQSIKIFERQKSLPSKEFLLTIYQAQISKIESQILKTQSGIIESFTNKSKSMQECVKSFEKLMLEYTQYAQSTFLGLRDNLKTLKLTITQRFSKNYEDIYNKFQQYFENCQDMLVKDQLHSIISTLVEVLHTTKDNQFKEKSRQQLMLIRDLIAQIEKQTHQTISDIQQSIDQKKQYKKGNQGQLHGKIEALKFFKKQIEINNLIDLSQHYNQLTIKIERLWQKISTNIDQNVKYSQSLHLLKISASISNTVVQFYQRHHKISEKVIGKLKTINKGIEDKLFSIKIDKIESLKKNFSKATFAQLQAYVATIFKPILQFGYDKQDPQLQSTLETIFQKVSGLFQEVDKIINQNKHIKFPSTLQSHFQFSRQNQLINEVTNYVEQITHIYYTIVNHVMSSPTLRQYFEKSYEKQSKRVIVRETEALIKEIFEEKYRKISNDVRGLAVVKLNIQLLNCLLKECEAWASLQKAFEQLDQLKQSQQMQEVIESIREKLRKIQGKQVTQIQKIFIQEQKLMRIKDVYRLVELYFDLRKNAENQVSEESVEHFSKIQQFLENYVRKIKIYLDTQYIYALQSSQSITSQFVHIFHQLIQFYEEFNSQFQTFDQSKDQKKLMKQIENYIFFMFKKIKEWFEELKKQIQELLSTGVHSAAKKPMKKLQKMVEFMIRFKKANIKAQSMLEDIQDNQIQTCIQQISQLHDKINEKTKKEELILQNNMLQRADLPFLEILYQNSVSKGSLMKKVKEFVQRQLTQCRQAALPLKLDKLSQFQDIVWQIPLQIRQHFKISQRIKELQIRIIQQQRKIAQEIKNLDLNQYHGKQGTIKGFSSLKQSQDKRYILDKIRVFYEKAVLSAIYSSEHSLKDKIDVFAKQVESVYVFLNANNFQLARIFYQIEQKFLRILLQTFKQKSLSFLALLEKKNVQKLDYLNIKENLQTVFQIMRLLRQKNQKYYKKDSINEIRRNFTDFKEKVMSFQVYCPIRSYQLEVNKNLKNEIFKQIILKIALYDELLYFKQDLAQNYNNEGEEIDDQMDNQGDQIQQISYQIQDFKDSIKRKVQNSKEYLQSFSFDKPEAQSDDLQRVAYKKIAELQFHVSQLERIANTDDESLKFYLISKQELKKLKQQLKKRFTRFIERKNEELSQFVENMEGELQIDLSYTHFLLDNVAQNEITYLQVGNKSAPELTITGKQYHMTFVQKLRDSLNQQIVESVTQITDTIHTIIPQKTEKFQSFKVQKNQQIYQLHQRKLERAQEAENENSGKDSDQIQIIVKENQSQFDAQIFRLQQTIKQKEDQLNEEIKQIQSQQLGEFCRLLIKIMKMQIALFSGKEKEQLKQIMLTNLQQMQKLKLVKQLAAKLAQFQNCDQIIHSIKSSSKMFQFQAQATFYQSTKAQDIQYTLDKLRTKGHNEYSMDEEDISQSNSLDKPEIKKNYEYVSKVFNDLKKSGRSVKEIKQSIHPKDSLHQIASILAVWSIMKTIKGVDDEILSQPIPHPVQIVTLILLITGGKTSNYQSKLAQVKTGEGKSIILAALAIFYARMKFKVKVVCYSKYLSQRDYLEFKDLFRQFEVQDRIYYGTFIEICQSLLQNEKGSLKDTAKSFFVQSQANEDKSLLGSAAGFLGKIKDTATKMVKTVSKSFNSLFGKKQKQITLIDQVDVLFENEYLGEIFCPVVKLNEPQFKELLKFAYELAAKQTVPKVTDILESIAYKNCIQKYPKLESILQMQVNGMICEFTHRGPKNSYQIHQKEIKYRDKDRLSTKLHYGYETIFANCKEYAAGRISQSNYEKNLFIPIKIGELSYSQLPSQSLIIQGLSGTVASLSDGKDNILQQKCGIPGDKIYILPSIYGQKSIIKESYNLATKDTFYRIIAQKVKTEYEKGRPIVVCFQNYPELKNFQKSDQFKSLDIKCSYLHQLQKDEMRDKAVKGAGSKKTVTLMTSEFSRGTDFLVIDRAVKKSGGLALIMAYIPKNQSQFDQFKGRTGRQGGNGTIDIFFNRDQFAKLLQQHQLNITLPQRSEQLQQIFYEYWGLLDMRQMEIKKKQLKSAKAKHEQFIEIIRNMDKAVKQNNFINYVKQLNKYSVPLRKTFNVLLGIDGTGSMSIIFKKLIESLVNIVSRINQIKQELNIESQFALQIAVYRNYNTGGNIIQATKQEKTPEELITFLNQVQVQGGQGNQAIEVLYRYINTCKTEFDMLILMGDAPPNTPEQIKEKRRIAMNKENKVWLQYERSPQYDKQFFKIQSSEEELKKFKKQFIIHGLVIKTTSSETQHTCNARFKRYLQSLCRDFSGESKGLDFSQKTAENEFVQFITTRISCLINGSQGKELIEQIYEKKFKSYV